MNPEHRRTQLIPTYTGRLVDVLALRAQDIDILDIAHALSLINRFTGHTRWGYSVAQHSIHVSTLVPPKYELQALLHDASEAYLTDISRPLKYAPEMAGYLDIEARTTQTINTRFGLFQREIPEIHHADMVALATEIRDLITRVEPDLGLPEPDTFWDCQEWTPREAELRFLARYKELTK